MAILGNASFAANQTAASDVGYVKPVEGWYPCTIKEVKDVADQATGQVTKFTVTYQIDAAAYVGGGREFRHTFPYPSPAVNADGRTGIEQDMTLKQLQIVFKPGSDEKQTATFVQEFNNGAYANVDLVVTLTGKPTHVYYKPDGREYTIKSGDRAGQKGTSDIFRLCFAPNFTKFKEDWLKEQQEMQRVAAMKAGTVTQASSTPAQTTTTGPAPTSFPGMSMTSPFPPTA